MEIQQPGSAYLTVTDGTTTVLHVKELDFTGATVTNGGGGIADITVTSGVTAHSALTQLDYASAGHTGFQPAITTGTTSQYFRGDLSLATFPTIPSVGTWGGLNYPTWSSGTPFVKMTAAGTFALDGNTYLTSLGTFPHPFNITNPTSAGKAKVHKAEAALTIVSLDILVADGTSITGKLRQYDANGGTATDISGSITASAGTNSHTTSFSGASITSGNLIGWENSAVSGAVTQVFIQYNYQK